MQPNAEQACLRAAVWIASLLCVFLGACQQVAEGSLVVLRMTNRGLVACADKRVWNDVSGFDDTRTKLVPLNSSLAFLQLGVEAILDSKHPKRRYSVRQEVQRFIRQSATSGKTESIEQVLSALQAHLRESYIEFAHKSRKSFGGTRVPPNPIYVLYFVYHPGGTIQVWKIEFLQPSVFPSQSKTLLKDITGVLAGGPLVDGQVRVINEIVKGKDPAFDDLRRDGLQQRVWSTREASEISAEEAIAFARAMIRWTSERHAKFFSSPALVSPTCDCALFDFSGSISWAP